jgi:predicted ABC-type ATPase
MTPPMLTLVAGPNGSGKSTISAGRANRAMVVVDPDAIARTLDPSQPSLAAIPAARKTILLCRSLVAKRDSFIVESGTMMRMLRILGLGLRQGVIAVR